MTELSQADTLKAGEMAIRLDRGDRLTQSDLDTLAAEWENCIDPPISQRSERFAVVSPSGAPTGVVGPRWIFHLFGLRHCAVEIALTTPSGLIILQRRSQTKEEWPGAIDMAVAGHVSVSDDGSQTGFVDSAWKEISEEIGLDRSDAATKFVDGALIPIGDPYFCFEGDSLKNPPFLDAEVRQIFAATLTGDGLASIRFADKEVDGLLLVTEEMAWRIIRQENIASGLRYSLPRYLDWREKQHVR